MKQFELDQAQQLVRDAIRRSDKRHARWRELEAVYKTGDLVLAATAKTAKSNPDLVEYADLDRGVVNLVKPNIDILLASTLRHDPRLLAVPIAGGMQAEEQKHLAEHVTSHFWRTERVTGLLKDATIDMLKLGNGFLKVGWIHEEGTREASDEDRALLLEDQLEVEFGMARLEGREPRDPDELVELLPDEVDAVLSNQPFVSYVSPFDMFVPPNARRLSETRWVCQRVTMPIDELEENDLYDGSVEIKADAGSSGGMSHEEHVAEWVRQQEREHGLRSDERWETATLFEFYDMGTRRMMVFQIDSDEPLYEGEIPYGHRHTPFVHLRNHSTSGNEFWAMGDVEVVAGVQSIFNEFVLEQIDNARRSGNKYLIAEEAITDELRAAIESDMPDVVATVKTNQMPLSEVVKAVERKALSGDVYAAKQDLERWMGVVLGINDFQQGGVGADRMSATAAAVVDGVASLRGEEKVWQVEQAAAHVGLLMLLLCQEFLDTELAVRIAGDDGVNWQRLTGTELVGEYVMDVESGSMTAVNPATREQKASRMIAELVPAVAQLGFDPEPMLRIALKDLGFDPDVVLQRQPPPPAVGQSGPEGLSPLPGEEGAPPAAVPGGPGGPVEAQLAADLAL